MYNSVCSKATTEKGQEKMSTHILPENITVTDLEKTLETIKKLHAVNFIMWFVSDTTNEAMLDDMINGLEGAIKVCNMN